MKTENQHWAEQAFGVFLELFGKVWPALGAVLITALLFVACSQFVCLIQRCWKGGDQ